MSPPLRPCVAVLGGGQLGRMLALAGHRLGIHVRCLDPSPEACAGQVTELVVGKYEDPSALLTLIKGADVVTYESENIPVDVLEYIGARGTRVHPCHQALAQFQDRLSEKKLAQELGCRTVTFADMEPLFEGDLDGALATVGLPAIIKTRRLGYDGKSQCRIATRADAGSAMVMLGGLKEGANLIAEERLEFDYEASLIAIAPLEGDPIFYPLTVNVHHDGILHTSRTARGAETWLEYKTQDIARKFIEYFRGDNPYVGALTIEFFVKDRELYVNELAPRVHNSGHWTIDGAETSQFENHLRAVLGLPPGSTSAHASVGMVNVIGQYPDLAELYHRVPNANVHFYGKVPRPGRKLGHVTVCSARLEQLEPQLLALTDLCPIK